MSTLTILNGSVFDGESATLIDGPVHVVDGVVAQVGGTPIDADRVIDAAGKTVLPGLIDAHFHAYGTDMDILTVESEPLSYLALAASRRLEAALRRGFTTVRDPSGGDAGLERAIADGLIRAPRYLWMGAALCQSGGHGDPRPADRDLRVGEPRMSEVVDGVEPLRVAARSRLRRGAHAIKIMTSGGISSPTLHLPEYSPEEVRAVSEEAARQGTYVTAHAYSVEAVRLAIDNGARCIEHGNLIDAETAEAMSAVGAFLVPTLVVYDAMHRRGADFGIGDVAERAGEVLVAGRRAIGFAREAGVRIGFGTDLMGAMEDDQLRGLQLQIDADGVLNTLRSATSVNADLIRRPDLGRIHPGSVADLLILDADPFENPAVLWDEAARTVVQAGIVL